MKPILISLLVLFSLTGIAQNQTILGKAIYLELGGKGFMSGNFEVPLNSRNRLNLGLTLLDNEFEKEADEEDYPNLVLPTPGVMYFHLSGRGPHYFESGLGLSVSPVFWRKFSENDSPLSLHGSLGYRYQKADHFLFRAGFTPFYRVKWAFLPLIGVSLGYSW
ncbi:hypothetical protein [Jiulongibacter sediminis]|jgi:hypothetical protein|uniref:hypothetical protein n=1 Tax=Jiulongibacter sediminis TaxID=1605367 RepID=UPI0026F031ED|nr:hypothetical protein [Jiulongibacter sediminis]